jgi:hypothetical protein
MKYIVGAIVALMLLVPAAMGNIMTQMNEADAYGSGTCGVIVQNELNAGLSIGSNTVTQSNKQWAESVNGFDIQQSSANLALALGTGNTVTQRNEAWANGGQVDQDQLNALVVLGHDNLATQDNKAKAEALREGKKGDNPIYQNQANLGLIVGLANKLTQTNDAYAIIPKTCKEDPTIKQNQMNIGVLISATDCHEEEEEEEPPECECDSSWEPDCSC